MLTQSSEPLAGAGLQLWRSSWLLLPGPSRVGPCGDQAGHGHHGCFVTAGEGPTGCLCPKGAAAFSQGEGVQAFLCPWVARSLQWCPVGAGAEPGVFLVPRLAQGTLVAWMASVGTSPRSCSEQAVGRGCAAARTGSRGCPWWGHHSWAEVLPAQHPPCFGTDQLHHHQHQLLPQGGILCFKMCLRRLVEAR